MGLLQDVVGAGCVAIAVALSGSAAAAACAADQVDIRGDFGTVRFKVELATTPADQARGLMFREEMPHLAGMLFVYPRESKVSFWMRNTLIPLDMIFVDAEGRVVNVHPDAIPHDETPIPSAGPSSAVLEINGGVAAEIGIQAGDEVRSPVLPQTDAAWPCE